MSGPYWGQFSLHHAPAAERVYPALLGGGDYYDSIGHSSSGSSSHVDSQNSNSTTYGAHSPTLINCQYLIDTNVEAYYNIESENSHDSSQVMVSSKTLFYYCKLTIDYSNNFNCV